MCNINYARIHIARVDTQYIARVSHVRAATIKEDSHLRICPYKEGVGNAQSQMPLHVVGRLMSSWYHLAFSSLYTHFNFLFSYYNYLFLLVEG